MNAYDFILPALRLVHDYLSNRKQRIKIENNYSTWMEIIYGVSHGSILGPLSFNIFLADLFFIINYIDIANHEDDNTPYATVDNIDDLIKSLKEASTSVFQRFDNNLLKSNPDKCHLPISSKNVTVPVGEYEIENSKCEKLLGVKLGWKLIFLMYVKKHVEN